ncbi:hypothetical protein DFH09DRAFT_1331092 [Mycena vulgaris]|nr:hypothetical protein DFH09DRAFT_1331092 [Mycena vulgaris]
MSLFVEGRSVASFTFSGFPRTQISTAFSQILINPNGHLLVIAVVPPSGLILFPPGLCSFSAPSHDVVLGLDWSSQIRESFISLEFRIGSSFDAWRSLIDPAHPMQSVPFIQIWPLKPSLPTSPSHTRPLYIFPLVSIVVSLGPLAQALLILPH